jgi:hypothetical protein
VDRDFRAAFYFSVGHRGEREVRRLRNVVHGDADFVAHAVHADIHLPLLVVATEHIGECPEGLQRMALLAARGTDVIRLIGHPRGVVQALAQDGHGQPGPVVLHAERVGRWIVRDRDHRQAPGAFAGIQGIVHKLPHDGAAPVMLGDAEFFGEFALGKELQRTRDPKHGTGWWRRRHSAVVLSWCGARAGAPWCW